MFTGQVSSKKKVALGGRSRQEETRDEALRRARSDRERRKQQKLEQKSATCIQVCLAGERERGGGRVVVLSCVWLRSVAPPRFHTSRPVGGAAQSGGGNARASGSSGQFSMGREGRFSLGGPCSPSPLSPFLPSCLLHSPL